MLALISFFSAFIVTQRVASYGYGISESVQVYIIAITFLLGSLMGYSPWLLSASDLVKKAVYFLPAQLTFYLSFCLLAVVLKRINVSTAGVLTYSSLVFGLILAYIFFGEVPTIPFFLGSLLIIFGAYISQRAKKERSRRD